MDNMQLAFHAVVLIGALLITAAAQLTAVRFLGGRIGVVMSLFIGFAGGLVALIVGEAILFLRSEVAYSDCIGLALANAVLFICCWYFYFHFINIGEASLRIRVLREVRVRAGGVTMEELLNVYNVTTVIAARTSRLVADGQLTIRDGLFYAGQPRMVVVARAFSFARWVLLGPEAARRFHEPLTVRTSPQRMP